MFAENRRQVNRYVGFNRLWSHGNSICGQRFCSPSSIRREGITRIKRVRGYRWKAHRIMNHYDHGLVKYRNTITSGATTSVCNKVRALSDRTRIAMVTTSRRNAYIPSLKDRFQKQLLPTTLPTPFEHMGVGQ